jgi:UDP:flavonoid glycosyltransferase YjiC (YdhE family)
MTTILFTWELGSNLGHVTTIAPVARELRECGHRVVAALRDLSNANVLQDCELLPACAYYSPKRPTVTYADILANAGFDDVAILSSQVAAWRNVFRLVRPDVIVADHSPTVLLAARISAIPYITLGTGFYVPPDVTPLPSLMTGASDAELQVLTTINRIAPMQRLADLYHGAERHLLTTVPELDHFGPRMNAEYLGPICDAPPESVVQADVLAYLHQFRGLEAILQLLASYKSVAVVPRYTGTSRIVRSSPVNLQDSLRHAKVCVTHGSHGTTASALLAGCPVVMFPTQVEQYILATKIEELGYGLIARPGHVEETLERVLMEPAIRKSVQAFAERYQFGTTFSRIAGRTFSSLFPTTI